MYVSVVVYHYLFNIYAFFFLVNKDYLGVRIYIGYPKNVRPGPTLDYDAPLCLYFYLQ